MSWRMLAATLSMLAASGCGAVYTSSRIQDVAGDDGVQVIEMTPAMVARANAVPFQPPRLPAAFSQVAGASQPRSAPVLPDPVFDPETRPSALELRVPPAANPGPYRIGTGDVLVLATPRGSTTEELAGLVAAQNQRQGYTVQDDGTIAIPDVGRVMVRGMTPAEAEDAVFQRLVEARITPSFTLEIAEFNSRRVSVGGAVARPGIVPVTMSPLFLDELIAASGGLTVADDDFAVVRIYRDGSLYQIPVRELFATDGLMQVRLVDGDSVFVDTAYDLDLAQAFYEQQIARANFTRQARADAIAELQAEMTLRRGMLQESRDNFRSRLEFGAEAQAYAYVMGEVVRPRRFALPFENRAVVADALLEAGGPTTLSGDPSQIYVLRPESSSVYLRDVIAYRLDGTNAANFVLATRMELRPGDVVFVAEQPITRWNRVISQILPTVSLGGQLDQ